jgi:hypothetical protein
LIVAPNSLNLTAPVNEYASGSYSVKNGAAFPTAPWKIFNIYIPTTEVPPVGTFTLEPQQSKSLLYTKLCPSTPQVITDKIEIFFNDYTKNSVFTIPVTVTCAAKKDFLLSKNEVYRWRSSDGVIKANIAGLSSNIDWSINDPYFSKNPNLFFRGGNAVLNQILSQKIYPGPYSDGGISVGEYKVTAVSKSNPPYYDEASIHIMNQVVEMQQFGGIYSIGGTFNNYGDDRCTASIPWGSMVWVGSEYSKTKKDESAYVTGNTWTAAYSCALSASGGFNVIQAFRTAAWTQARQPMIEKLESLFNRDALPSPHSRKYVEYSSLQPIFKTDRTIYCGQSRGTPSTYRSGSEAVCLVVSLI